MADSQSFSDYFGIDEGLLPKAEMVLQGGPRRVIEVCSPIKTSTLLTHNLANKSNKKEIVENVGVDPSLIASKGPNYNKYIVDFINRIWNPEAARQNSDSLDRMIRRIEGI